MKNTLLVLLVSIFIYSCGGGEWSTQSKNNFLNACVQEAKSYASESQAYSYCNCCLDKLQKIYDEDAFATEEAKMYMGLSTSEEFNQNMAEVVVECAIAFTE